MRWVLIETGSNQPYIFATNKQRLQLAASHQVRQLGEEWIAEAVEKANDLKAGSARHVVQASGTGVVLVDTAETGREIVHTVTVRAITERTGLDVWGYVHDRDNPDDEPGTAAELTRAQRQHGLLRAQRLSPLAQAPNNPFEQQCSFTGRPASPFEGDRTDAYRDQQRSAVIDALWRGSAAARTQLFDGLAKRGPDGAEELGAGESESLDESIVSAERLTNEQDIRHNGWVGVLHADGNGIGSIFSHLALAAAARNESFIDLETRLSQDLGNRMWRVVAETIVECRDKRTVGGDRSDDWVLPIVIGGDDVTIVLHGGMAWDFATLLIEKFADAFSGEPFQSVLADIKKALTVQGDPAADTIPDSLTLGAGLVFVKPHHPFSHAVSLAEELAASAKRWCKPLGGIDVEVLHESAVRDLDSIRESQQAVEGGKRFLRYGGPFIVGAGSEAHPRHISHLEDLVARIEDGGLSRSALHALRETINTDTTPDKLQTILRNTFVHLKARRDVDNSLVDALEEDALKSEVGLADDEMAKVQGRPGPGDGGGTPDHFTRIVTALDLIDVAHGTAAARADSPEPDPEGDEP